MTSTDLLPKNLELETKQAFDLLDAISRSGSLSIDVAAELHVVVAVAHCFDKTIVETVIHDNVNPIASVERSLLLLASAILGSDQANQFLLDGTDARRRLETSLPSYFARGDLPASSASDGPETAKPSSIEDDGGVLTTGNEVRDH